MPASIPGPDPVFATPRLLARALGPDDAPALQAVFEAAGDYFRALTGQPRPDPDAAARELQACAQTTGREAVLLQLRDADEPVGTLGWWEGTPEPDLALLGMILLVPDHRGHGLAREALAGLETVLADRGLRRLRTGVGAHEDEKHALLRALGFEPLDQRTHVSLDRDRGRVMIALFEKPLG